jgi:hypothetical protein
VTSCPFIPVVALGFDHSSICAIENLQSVAEEVKILDERLPHVRG